MTDTTAAAILVAIPLILAAIGNLVVAIITARRVSEVKTLTDGLYGDKLAKVAEATAKTASVTGDPVDVDKAKTAKKEVAKHKEAEEKSKEI